MKHPTLFLAAAFVGGALSAQQFQWRLAANNTPSARLGHSITWNPATQKAVMFGGATLTGGTNEMWAWDGSAWASVVQGATLPSPRTGHAIAYDSARQRLVLFGGSDPASGTANSQTWEWDNVAWTQKSPTTSPSARTEGAMVYGLGQMLLFGGTANGSGSGARFGDSWTWNGTNWTQVATTGPTARFDHAMAFDNAAGNIKLFGGNTQALPATGGHQNDLWSWNGTAWTQITTTTAPPARRFHKMVFDSGRNKLVMFGGTAGGSTNFNDSWSYDATNGWVQLSIPTGPSARHAHAMAYDEVRQELVMHGGNIGPTYSAETWVTPSTVAAEAFAWRQAANTNPGARQGHTLSWFGNNQSMLMFGGAVTGVGMVNQMWSWDGAQWTQPNQGTTLPSARSGHVAGYDLIRRKLVVFGGQNSSGVTNNETWEWDGAAWTQRLPTTSPSPRAMSGLAYGLGQMLLFGGQSNGSGAGTFYGDTWNWNGINWVQVSSTGPTARFGHAMSFDSVASDIKLFGGNTQALPSTGGHRNDLWSWNGSAWSQITTNTPPLARRQHQMTFDRQLNKLVVFGGNAGGSSDFSDTWTYTTSSGWSQIPTVGGPLARHDAAMGYDEVRKEVVLHGGLETTLGALSPETWVSPGAFFNAYGSGCVGSAGTPTLTATSRPVFGAPFTMRVSNVGANSVGWMVIGFQNQAWNSIPLPFNLANLGFPIGCFLLVDNATTLLQFANASGIANVSLTLPPPASAFALPLYVQYTSFNPASTSSLQFVWSNAGVARVGF